MLKRLLLVVLSLIVVTAHAQFTPGQILTAAQLNGAFSNVLPVSGGTLTGPLTVPSLSVTGAPIPLASGGTGANTATGATSQLQYLQGANGSSARSVTAKLQDTVSLLDFGADPTDTADSTTALRNWYSALVSTGKAGYIPAGKYKITSQIVWDMASVQSAGIKIYGDGAQSVLDLTAVSTGPALLIENSANTGAFYSSFTNFAVATNVNGVGVQLGQESYADALNTFEFNLVVNNVSTGSSACAVEVNYVLNSRIALVTNLNSASASGDSLRLRQAQFNYFAGSYSTAPVGLHLTAGYNFGNIFQSQNSEVVNTSVVIDNATSTNNTWLGGTFVWTNGVGPAVTGINATAGSNNRFIGVNYGSSPIATGTTGIIVDNAGYGTLTAGGSSISPVSGDGVTSLNSISGNGASVQFKTAGSIRWSLQRNNATESGSNAGSNLLLTRYNDSGVSIDNPITVVRSTGLVSFADGINVSGINVLPNLSGTTGSIGGSALAAGACSSGTVAVTGATTSMSVVASPATYPGDGNFWEGYVSAAGTVTVKVCASIAATPTASAYNVRVLQ
jgi:hypothetical protein